MVVLTKLQSTSDYENYLNDNKTSLVVLFFAASWSEESKLMSDVVNELAKNNQSSFRILEIEAENFEELSLKHGVESVPTFIFLRNRETVYRFSGADANELRKKLAQLGEVNQTIASANSQESLNQRLASLINSAPIVAFIKGTPQEPRCGFTRQLLSILEAEHVRFGFFDILSDNEVREGLKKYSNWPTYPQLYVNGELIGGLDIVKEMVQSGEFKSIIQKSSETLNDSAIRLKKLINKSKVMLFMKGNAKEPKCGFSRQIVQILNEAEAKYESFDILSDEEVRQGLKEYSNWPTYPQLYVDGELVGGLDIVKELNQNGELKDVLSGKN